MPLSTLIVIVGPTGAGKTDLSIQLAKHYSCEIVSADSRQVYKEMTIGTCVPTISEQQGIKHHMLHNKSIKDQPITAGIYEKEAYRTILECFKKNNKVIVVGGTGLYIDALTNGLENIPEVNPSIRENLNDEFRSKGLEPLQKQLHKLDPDYYKIADIHNPRRILRALEVSIGTGTPYSTFLNKKNKTNPFNTLKIGLNMDRNKLYEKLNQRVEIMIQQGLLDEVKSLIPYKKHPSLHTIGYQELFDYFEGKLELKEAIEQIKQNTRRYAKRQLTWFRKDQEITWFDSNSSTKNIIDFIDLKIKSSKINTCEI